MGKWGWLNGRGRVSASPTGSQTWLSAAVGWRTFPQRHVCLEADGTALFGIMSFADVTNVRILRYHAGLVWALNLVTGVLKRDRKGDTHTHRGKAMWRRRQKWSDVSTSLGMPGATRSWKWQEGSSLRASRKSQHCGHLDLGLLVSRTVKGSGSVIHYKSGVVCYSRPRKLIQQCKLMFSPVLTTARPLQIPEHLFPSLFRIKNGIRGTSQETLSSTRGAWGMKLHH